MVGGDRGLMVHGAIIAIEPETPPILGLDGYPYRVASEGAPGYLHT